MRRWWLSVWYLYGLFHVDLAWPHLVLRHKGNATWMTTLRIHQAAAPDQWRHAESVADTSITCIVMILFISFPCTELSYHAHVFAYRILSVFFSVLLLSTRSGFFSVVVSINPPNAAPGTERGILMREHESCLKWMNEWMIRLMTANSGNILFEKQMSWHVRPIYYRTRNCFRIYYSKSMRSFEPSLNRISNLFFDGGIFKGKYHHVYYIHTYYIAIARIVYFLQSC